MSNIEISFSSSIILHTSRYLFDQHGFHNVGVDRISKESNVSKMTLYKHFKNKENLIKSCIECNQKMLMEEVTLILSSDIKELDKLQEIYFLHVDLKNHYHLLFKALFEIKKKYPNAFEVILDYREWLVDALVDFFSEINGFNQREANFFLYLIDGSIVYMLDYRVSNNKKNLWEIFCSKYFSKLNWNYKN